MGKTYNLDVNVPLCEDELKLLFTAVCLKMDQIEAENNTDNLVSNEEYDDYDFLAYYLNSFLRKVHFLKIKIKEDVNV